MVCIPQSDIVLYKEQQRLSLFRIRASNACMFPILVLYEKKDCDTLVVLDMAITNKLSRDQPTQCTTGNWLPASRVRG